MCWAPDDQVDSYAAAMDEALLLLMDACADHSAATISPEYGVVVDDAKAEFSAWYELFPRSYSPTPGEHGTLRDLIEHLPYVASMGFDVLYLAAGASGGQGVSQRKEQRGEGAARGRGQPVGDWIERKGATRRSIRSWERWTIFMRWWRRRKKRELRLRWILRFSARPIIRT